MKETEQIKRIKERIREYNMTDSLYKIWNDKDMGGR